MSGYWKINNIVTKEYLKAHPNEIFVFGDNLLRRGYGGAAKVRDCKNTYGFITKKAPNNLDSAFYKPEEYRPVFINELILLISSIDNNYNKTFLISPIGSGLANRYHIWEEVIKDGLEVLIDFPNVKFLY